MWKPAYKPRDYHEYLSAPKSYWCAPPHIKAKLCNGAGPDGKGWLVPDTIYGLRITEAATRVPVVRHVMLRLRYGRATAYYEAVCEFGTGAFEQARTARPQPSEYTNPDKHHVCIWPVEEERG